MSKLTQRIGALGVPVLVFLTMTLPASALVSRDFRCVDSAGRNIGNIAVAVLSPTQILAVGPGGQKTLNRVGRGQTYVGSGYSLSFSADQKSVALSFAGGRGNCVYSPGFG